MGPSRRCRVPRVRSRAVRRYTARLVAVTATLLVVAAATFPVSVARASAADGAGWQPPVPGGDPAPSGSDWAHRADDEAGDLARAFAPTVGPPVPLQPPGGGDNCGTGVPVIGPVVHAACAGIDWASRETRDALRAGLGVL